MVGWFILFGNVSYVVVINNTLEIPLMMTMTMMMTHHNPLKKMKKQKVGEWQ